MLGGEHFHDRKTCSEERAHARSKSTLCHNTHCIRPQSSAPAIFCSTKPSVQVIGIPLFKCAAVDIRGERRHREHEAQQFDARPHVQRLESIDGDASNTHHWPYPNRSALVKTLYASASPACSLVAGSGKPRLTDCAMDQYHRRGSATTITACHVAQQATSLQASASKYCRADV